MAIRQGRGEKIVFFFFWWSSYKTFIAWYSIKYIKPLWWCRSRPFMYTFLSLFQIQSALPEADALNRPATTALFSCTRQNNNCQQVKVLYFYCAYHQPKGTTTYRHVVASNWAAITSQLAMWCSGLYSEIYALTLSHRSSMQLHDIYRPQCGGKCVCLHPWTRFYYQVENFTLTSPRI